MSALRKEITITFLPSEYAYCRLDKDIPIEDQLFLCHTVIRAELPLEHSSEPQALRLVASSEPLEELPNAINGKARRDVGSLDGEYYFIQGLQRWDPEAWEFSRYLYPGLRKWLADFGDSTIYFTIQPLPEDQAHAA